MNAEEDETGSSRPLALGCPVAYGVSAVGRRLDAFARHWPLTGERLLDVGCGNGAYTTAMAPGFTEVHGIDVEPRRVEEFRTQVVRDPRFHLEVGSAEDLSQPDDHFDVVTAIEVIEHVVHLDQAIAEIHRVLRPGGAFLVSCPNRLFPLETHTVRLGPGREYPARVFPFLPYVKPLHRRLSTARNFTRRDLTVLAAAHRFRVVGWDWVMPPLDNWRPGRRLLRPFLDRVERSPLRIFGVSIIAVLVKDPAFA
ncbi:MAG: class I SAM-dependent methyltransferase [Actinomycetota bacterium]|nr:class I SAM-dependent methyltransferase [Actinomycetota bacterium]